MKKPIAIPVAAAGLLLGAAPAPTIIPLPGLEGEALVIPAGSPVQFRGFGKDHVAQFNGRFTLAGTFAYGCEIECDPPLKQFQLTLKIVPDPAVAARLPHWKLRSGDMRLYIRGEARLVQALGNSAQRAALRSGKLDALRGRIAIVADDYRAAIECDSASYSARFVAVAKPAQVAEIAQNGTYGCG